MKSVKTKLFTLYAITITVILLFLTLISLYFLQINKDNKTIELIDNTSYELDILMFEKKVNLSDIDKYIDLQNQFLIIFKNKELVFTNQSKYKTQNILKQIDYEEHYEEDEQEYHHEKEEHLEEKYKDFIDDGFIEIDDFIFTLSHFEEQNNHYEIYLGVNKKFLNKSINSIYKTIIILNIIILIILLGIGYILINKTIKPLKQILQEIKLLQKNQELSQRLKELKTGDEFEELTNSFNTMLQNIETSVESIKQFSSDASHELKTPLTIIQGEIELCKNKNLPKDELIQIIQKIDKEQKKLQNIINDFLLLSRLDKELIKSKKALLDKIIFETIEQNLEAIEAKNLELKLNIDDNLEINFDEKYLSIVINNLISNASKYTNKGYILIETKKEQNHIYLYIKDTGIGINKKDQKKIFDRFYRVDKVRTSNTDGIGLGLAIVKKICDKFNTPLELKSIVEKGSNFKLTFKTF